MFINKTSDGRNNICGKKISLYRKELNISQRELADRLQLVAIAKVIGHSFHELLG